MPQTPLESRDSIEKILGQLITLTSLVSTLDSRLAGIDQWIKLRDDDIEDHEKLLRGNGKDGLDLRVDREHNRVNLVFAVGAGAWTMVTILFSIIAANLVDKVTQLAAAIK